MKRTSLKVRQDLLEEAVRLGGERTRVKTVERTLQDFVRHAKAGRILELGHSDLWHGDLAEMREDRPSANSLR